MISKIPGDSGESRHSRQGLENSREYFSQSNPPETPMFQVLGLGKAQNERDRNGNPNKT